MLTRLICRSKHLFYMFILGQKAEFPGGKSGFPYFCCAQNQKNLNSDENPTHFFQICAVWTAKLHLLVHKTGTTTQFEIKALPKAPKLEKMVV